MKITVVDERGDLGGAYEYEIGKGSKPDYSVVTWARLKANVKREQSIARNVRALEAEVYVRPAMGNTWLENFYQEFGLDDRAALNYAKYLLKEGIADSAWVYARIGRPFGMYGRKGSISKILYQVDKGEG